MARTIHTNLSAIMSWEWLEEAESSAEVICLPTRLRTINCMVIDMDGSFGYDPGLGSISYHLP
jgi:hypothetical protein